MELPDIIFYLLILIVFYVLYQYLRMDECFKIKLKWKQEKDERHEKYKYYYIFRPKRHNWYGLKWPSEKSYPNK